MLSRLPRIVFDQFIRGYSEKQWGLPAHLLSSDLAKRIPIRLDDDPRYHPAPRTKVCRAKATRRWSSGCWRTCPSTVTWTTSPSARSLRRRLTIFTGPIDEYYDYELGRLKYRGQLR